ncbi:N-acetylmuramoyl-L-alanine amidase [Blautia schinkii]|nr:N-acetylmuramoyl-L-alanine amidase [Blautia schinkii]
MKKHFMELTMACLLLICFFFLSREAADVSKELSSQKLIVVDAGHGGSDPGMIGVGGLEEKGINLAIASKLKTSLESRGFTVVMTREEDVGLYEENAHNKKAQDLQKRISLIKETKPLLSVSIHQNSYEDSAVYGPQVFYYADSPDGEALAKVLQEKLNTGLAVERPRVAKGNTSYYLLKRSPGILNIVECGFLTNPDEAALLQTEEYQQKVADAVTAGICEYLGE